MDISWRKLREGKGRGSCFAENQRPFPIGKWSEEKDGPLPTPTRTLLAAGARKWRTCWRRGTETRQSLVWNPSSLSWTRRSSRQVRLSNCPPLCRIWRASTPPPASLSRPISSVLKLCSSKSARFTLPLLLVLGTPRSFFLFVHRDSLECSEWRNSIALIKSNLNYGAQNFHLIPH